MSRASILAKAIGADGILNVGDVAGLAAIASSGSATDLTTGTIPVARVGDASVTLAKLSATGTKDATTFLRGDNSFAVVSVTPTAVSDQNNTSTGAFDVPTGTTAQRPASPSVGMVRYNTDLTSLENYTAAGWFRVSVPIPFISSISGTIYVGITSTLTLNGSFFNAGQAGTVNFTSGATVANVTVTPSSDALISVTVPASIYGLVSGSSVAIKYTNSDNGVSAAITLTSLAIPTGGTIVTSGGYRYHTFTSSSNYVVPSGFSRASEYLLVAGGGGGGGGRQSPGGGGGGAGGLLYGTTTPTAGTTFTITVGAAGAGMLGNPDSYGGGSYGTNGTNSQFGALTAAIGGGSGGAYGSTAGGSGGSGGGGGWSSPTSGGAGTSGQGFAGGDNGQHANQNGPSGGGAGAVGTTGNGAINGAAANGGIGLNTYSTWATATSTGDSGYYSGGGGGGQGYNQACGGTNPSARSSGGLGGGGTGGRNSAGNMTGGNGSTNTGGGGGGCGSDCSQNMTNQAGGNGGSGIVIIRYAALT